MPERNNMMNEKILQEEFEESKIKLFMAQFAELEGKKLMEENNELSKDSFYFPSEKQKQMFIKRLNIHFIRSHVITFVRRLVPKHYSKIAFILPITILLVLTTFLSVGAFRTSIFNLFIQVEREYTAIRLGENKQYYLNVDWKEAYVPTKFPSGYRIVNVTNNQNMKSIEYEDENSGFILFQQHNESSGIHVDTEEANEVLHTQVHGQEGLLVRKKDLMTLAWKEKTKLFIIMGSATSLSKDDLIEIAESVQLIK